MYLNTLIKTLKTIVISTSAVIIVACGGGGSDPVPTPTPITGCAGASYTPTISYNAIAPTVGVAVNAAPISAVPSACAGSVSYSIASGALPAGLSLNTSTGVISGTPTSAQTANFAVSMTVTGYSAVSSSAITVVVSPAPAAGPKQWTFMVYVAGDNSLDEFAVADFNELKAAASNANVNVVLQIEKGSRLPTALSGGLGSSTYRGLVTGASTSLTDIGNQNMASPTTLSTFVSWAKATYPATNYGLVLWSHGGGWKSNKAYRGAFKANRGALIDEASSNNYMSLSDIRTALTNGMGVGNKLAVLAFDACLMGQYEVAYELRNNAQYLVASEELVPGPGMPYTQVTNILTSAPTSTPQSPQSFATGMANAFNASYLSNTNESTTMSVVDLTQMNTVHSKVLDLASASTAVVSSQAAVLNSARASSVSFGGSNTSAGNDAVDLWRYADYIATNASGAAALTSAATALKTALTAAVVTNTTSGPSMTKAKGMAIYLPFSGANYYSADYIASASSNAAVAGKSTWADFLSALYAGATVATKVVGDFAFYITWTNPVGIKVDVDLVVNEPRGNFASPGNGANSPNGLLSADSYYSGQNYESYTALSLVEKGAYDVFANLYECTTTAGAAVANVSCTTKVTLCSKTGAATAFTCGTPVTLDKAHSNLGTAFYTAPATYWPTVTSSTSPYWDWFYFGGLTKGQAFNKPFDGKTQLAPSKR